jgi:oxygen-independent coproporphyrinogen III oxidase
LIQINEWLAIGVFNGGMMWPYHPDLLAKPVPRYTSYPPATAFGSDVGAAEQAEALNSIAPGTPISIYVHIPYCHSICWYCGCNTGLAGKRQRLTNYLEALEAEIRSVARLLGGRGKVTRIALGGGSPNAIEPLAFVRLIDHLVTTFVAGEPEISVEIDPRNFDLEWAMTLAISGVNRVSFGVQSFDADIQAAIGRIQPVEMIETCVAALRARGVGSINFDLMYGLPLQTIEKLDATLDDVVRLQPDRIALFGYAHLPEIFARQRRIDAQKLPNTRARFDMATHGHDRLTSVGYHAIGFDHFALPHDSLAQAVKKSGVRRNFQGFTDDGNDIVIGLGASAISIFADRIIQNEKNVGAYRQMCAIGDLPGRRGVVLDAEAMGRGAIIEKILCDGRVKFSPEVLSASAWQQLRNFASKGLLEIDDAELHVRDAGRPYSRHIAAVFDGLFAR